jgi:hypothetical protein
VLFDQAAALRVSHCFESRVRAKLAIDVVQVVSERLRGDLQLAGDGGRVASLGEEREDRLLPVGQELDRRLVRCLVVDRDHLPSRGQHLAKKRLLAPSLVDIARQAHEESPSRTLVVEDDRRHVDPEPIIRRPYRDEHPREWYKRVIVAGRERPYPSIQTSR